MYRTTSTLSLFFFIMLRRPPISPLFPYTTLFRSLFADFAVLYRLLHASRLPVASEAAAESWIERRREACRDRKSTRLNSSHTVISYAVFCLKKKKKRNTWKHNRLAARRTCMERYD